MCFETAALSLLLKHAYIYVHVCEELAWPRMSCFTLSSLCSVFTGFNHQLTQQLDGTKPLPPPSTPQARWLPGQEGPPPPQLCTASEKGLTLIPCV